MIDIYIFAGGDNDRWETDYPKEMAVVDGEPVLFRTIRQCKERGIKPFVVSHKSEILGYQSELVEDCLFITNTFPTLAHACRGFSWGEKTIFLLGDVYYTDYALNVIASVPRMVFGTEVEIFAFKFHRELNSKLGIAFSDVIFEWGRDNANGKLWEVYRAFEGKKIDEHVILNDFAFIEDRTTDFDTVEEYEEFLCQD
jgi:hypothetical protein